MIQEFRWMMRQNRHRLSSLKRYTMKPIEIAFVCYAVTDLKRARAFYEKVLNLKPGNVWDGD